jgi:hypothetical protein
MFGFGKKRRKKKFKSEIEVIDGEIDRSQRNDLNFSILTVEINHSIPRGLSKILPGNVVCFHLFKKHYRSYDKVIGPYYRRYFIVLPQTDRTGASIAKQRIAGLAEENNWGNVSVGMAVFPEDGKDTDTLLEKAMSEIGMFHP